MPPATHSSPGYVEPVFARIGGIVKLDSLAKIPSVACPILLVRGTRTSWFPPR